MITQLVVTLLRHFGLMRLAGVITMFFLGAMVTALWRREGVIPNKFRSEYHDGSVLDLNCNSARVSVLFA